MEKLLKGIQGYIVSQTGKDTNDTIIVELLKEEMMKCYALKIFKGRVKQHCLKILC